MAGSHPPAAARPLPLPPAAAAARGPGCCRSSPHRQATPCSTRQHAGSEALRTSHRQQHGGPLTAWGLNAWRPAGQGAAPAAPAVCTCLCPSISGTLRACLRWPDQQPLSWCLHPLATKGAVGAAAWLLRLAAPPGCWCAPPCKWCDAVWMRRGRDQQGSMVLWRRAAHLQGQGHYQGPTWLCAPAPAGGPCWCASPLRTLRASGSAHPAGSPHSLQHSSGVLWL